MSVSDILLSLLLLLAPTVKGLYNEQEMLVFQAAVFITFFTFLWNNREFRLNRPLDFAVLAFLLSYLFTLPGAADFREALLIVMRIIAYFMIYLMVSVRARDTAFRQRLPLIIYLSGNLVVAGVLLNLAGIVSTSRVWDGAVILTTFEYKNTGALFLLICTLIGMYLWNKSDSPKSNILIGVGNSLNILMILGTQSRAIWLLAPAAFLLMLPGIPSGKRGATMVKTLICALPVIFVSSQIITWLQQQAPGNALLLMAVVVLVTGAGLFFWGQLETRISQRQTVLVAAVITVTIIIAAAFAVSSGSSDLALRFRSISLSNAAVGERLTFFHDAWKIIRQHPVFGAGGRGWDILYLNLQSYGYYAENVHNDFLQVAVEAGLVGLLSFLSLWTVFFCSGWNVYQRAEFGKQKELYWLSLVIGATIFLHILFDFDLPHSAMAFVLWSLFGIVRSAEPLTVLPVKPVLRSPLHLGILIIGIVYSLISLSFFIGDMYFAKAQEVINSGDLITARDYLVKAQTFDPRKTNTLISLA